MQMELKSIVTITYFIIIIIIIIIKMGIISLNSKLVLNSP